MTKRELHVKGIALIQVLLITAIFSTLLLIVQANVQQSLRQSQQILDATEARLNLYSTANELSFALLTRYWVGDNTGETDYNWNFYGQPFTWQGLTAKANTSLDAQHELLPNTTVEIQDIAGLVDLRTASAELTTLLQQAGYSALQAQQKQATLLAMQHYTRVQGLPFLAPGIKIQQLSELSAYDFWPAKLKTKGAAQFRTTGSAFNFYTAPNTVLQQLLPAAQFAILQRWRAEGPVSMQRFTDLTGKEPDEWSTFSPGRILKLHIRQGEQHLSMQLTLDAAAAVPIAQANATYTAP
ncbi:hypothetical protein [Alishewanella longhuensis]